MNFEGNMNSKLENLRQFIKCETAWSHLGLELAEELKSMASAERDRKALDVMQNCLGLFSAMYSQPPYELEEIATCIMQESIFTAVVAYCEILDTAWTCSELGSDRQSALLTVIDLMCRLERNKDKICKLAQDDLVAAFLVCNAIRNQTKGEPLLANCREAVWTGSECYKSVKKTHALDEFNRVIRSCCKFPSNEQKLPD